MSPMPVYTTPVPRTSLAWGSFSRAWVRRSPTKATALSFVRIRICLLVGVALSLPLSSSAQDLPDNGEDKEDGQVIGEAIYATQCAACHQASGNGIAGVFPPLKQDVLVPAEDASELVEIVLYGQKGKAIDGVAYSLSMPAFADKLTDNEIAAVVNYLRNEWGSVTSTIAADYVARMRE